MVFSPPQQCFPVNPLESFNLSPQCLPDVSFFFSFTRRLWSQTCQSFLWQRGDWRFGFLTQSPDIPSPPSWCPEDFGSSMGGLGTNFQAPVQGPGWTALQNSSHKWSCHIWWKVKYRDQVMHLVFHWESFSISIRTSSRPALGNTSESASFSYPGTTTSKLKLESGASQQVAKSHQGPRGLMALGREVMYPQSYSFPVVSFLPYLFLSFPPASLMRTVLICFQCLSFILKCLSTFYTAHTLLPFQEVDYGKSRGHLGILLPSWKGTLQRRGPCFLSKKRWDTQSFSFSQEQSTLERCKSSLVVIIFS